MKTTTTSVSTLWPLGDENPSPLCWKVFPSEDYESLCQNYGTTKVKLIHFIRHAEGTHNLYKKGGHDYRSEENIDARLTPDGIQQCNTLARTHPLLDADAIVTSPLTRCIQTAIHSFPHLVGPRKDEMTTTTSSSSTTTTTTTTKPSGIPFWAEECWRETVNYNCDRRRRISILQKEYPMVDFERILPSSMTSSSSDSEVRTVTGSVAGGDVYQKTNVDIDNDFVWEAYRGRVGPDWDTHMESATLYKVAERGRFALQQLQGRSERRIIVCSHSAFLRCLLNWGQQGGVPKMVPQVLDDRRKDDDLPEKTRQQKEAKILDYGTNKDVVDHDGKEWNFETYMRRDFENSEVRSLCLLVDDTSDGNP